MAVTAAAIVAAALLPRLVAGIAGCGDPLPHGATCASCGNGWAADGSGACKVVDLGQRCDSAPTAVSVPQGGECSSHNFSYPTQGTYSVTGHLCWRLECPGPVELTFSRFGTACTATAGQSGRVQCLNKTECDTITLSAWQGDTLTTVASSTGCGVLGGNPATQLPVLTGNGAVITLDASVVVPGSAAGFAFEWKCMALCVSPAPPTPEPPPTPAPPVTPAPPSGSPTAAAQVSTAPAEDSSGPPDWVWPMVAVLCAACLFATYWFLQRKKADEGARDKALPLASRASTDPLSRELGESRQTYGESEGQSEQDGSTYATLDTEMPVSGDLVEYRAPGGQWSRGTMLHGGQVSVIEGAGGVQHVVAASHVRHSGPPTTPGTDAAGFRALGVKMGRRRGRGRTVFPSSLPAPPDDFGILEVTTEGSDVSTFTSAGRGMMRRPRATDYG
eukprot:TRINITY_DN44013_c0_g1_i1.p1 TRINITY_DN44013_c0_g1~~TRINITY_DN44013_c0_g1_i1.p1  ORF type:complete len:465 (+),score=96.07 TRINITY_DN44013_c0_g1_i1:60-1397(+)